MLNKSFVSSTFASGLDLVLKTLTSFFLSVYIARTFGMEKFSIFTLGLSAQVILSQLVRYGMQELLLREMCAKKRIGVMNSYYSILILNSFVVIALFCILYFIFREQGNYIVIFIIGLRSIFFSDLLFKNNYYSKQEIVKFHFLSGLTSLGYIAVLVSGILLDLSFVWFSLLIISDVLIFYILFKFWTKKINFNFNFNSNIYLSYKYCLPMFFSSLTVVLYMNLDRWMLFYQIDNSAVALYGTAYRINSVAFQLIPIVLGVITPIIFSSMPKQEYDKKIGPTLFLLSLVSTALMYLISPILIVTFFGDEFIDAVDVSRALCLLVMLVFWGSFLGIYLIRDDNLLLSLKLNSLVLVINVMLNLLLIPIYGVLGAVYATLLSGVLSFTYLMIKNEEYWDLFKNYINLKCIIG